VKILLSKKVHHLNPDTGECPNTIHKFLTAKNAEDAKASLATDEPSAAFRTAGCFQKRRGSRSAGFPPQSKKLWLRRNSPFNAYKPPRKSSECNLCPAPEHNGSLIAVLTLNSLSRRLVAP
jgi:hypothetical protein